MVDSLHHTPLTPAVNVLILSTYASGGGAAVAAYRQFMALQESGTPVRMLIAAPTPQSSGPHIQSIGGVRWHLFRYLEKLQTLIRVKDPSLLFRFSEATTGLPIARHPWIEWADIIHIHWVQQSFLSGTGLRSLLQLSDKRVFWSLHDLWPLTGGCHVPYVNRGDEAFCCERMLVGCGCCPLLGSDDVRDFTAEHYRMKEGLSLERVHFLGVSRSVVAVAQASALSTQVSYLPNFFDPKLFFPKKRSKMRGTYRLLFVAARIDDPVKGLDLLRQVLEVCCRSSAEFCSTAQLICVGRLKERRAVHAWPIALELLPPVSQEAMAELYSSADLTLSTSRYETFGLTVLESQACGTPVCAFAVGGIPDLLPSNDLIEPYRVDLMAERILEHFASGFRSDPQQCTERAAAFAQPIVMQRLSELYSSR